jgi:predicted nucleic acid-binding protein
VIVVSNASPLILLARIGLLNSLPRIFGAVTVAREVYDEIVVRGEGLPGAREIQEASWIKVATVEDKELFERWRGDYHLGSGEVATIVLARQLAADLVMMDERKARVLAEDHELSVVGTVGLLETLYLRKEIPDLRSAFMKLVAEGIWIDRTILNHSLSEFALAPLSEVASREKVDDQESNRKSGIAYAAGFSLFASVAGLCGFGWVLDRWLGTAPWLLVTGLVLGAAAGFYQFIRLTSRLS